MPKQYDAKGAKCARPLYWTMAMLSTFSNDSAQRYIPDLKQLISGESCQILPLHWLQPCQGADLLDVLVGGLWAALSDVVGHSAREEDRLLRDHPDLTPQPGHVQIAQVTPVQQDLTGSHQVRPENVGHTDERKAQKQ